MNESEFNQRVDDTLTQIEEAIDVSGAEIDYELSGGILTLEFEDGSKVIVNRQAAVGQLWVAAKSGGYHLNFKAASGWVTDKGGEGLESLLNRVCSEQSQEIISLTLIDS